MDKTIRMAWLLGTYEDARLLVEVARQLPKNIKPIFLTYSQKAFDFITQQKFIAHLFAPAIKRHPAKEYQALEQRYGVPTLRMLYWSDPSLRSLPEDQVLPKTASYLKYFEDFFTKNKIEYFVYGTSGMLTERTAYAVAKAMRIPHFIMESGPLDRAGTLVLSDIDENWVWSEALDHYKELQKREMTSEERSFIQPILDNFHSKGKMYKMCKDPALTMVTTYVKGLFRYIKEGPSDAHVTLSERAKNEMTRWYRINRLKAKRNFFTTFNPKENYVFFPIHFIEDSQVTVREQFYYNQFELVRQIALSMPVGMTLYTKTHPDDLGGIPLEKLQGLRKIPNVRLLDPLTNSHDIIKHAKAVITINSTAGWEAMLYKKPLLVLGTVFYAHQKDVIRVTDIRTLPFKIQEALRKTPFYDETDWLKFVHSCIKTPGGGTIFRHYYNAPLRPEDVSGFAKTLGDKIERYEQQRTAIPNN